MFMALSLKEKNQDVINQAIRELQRAANVDTPSFTPVGDTNYSIQPTDSVINQIHAFTAPRTWTFPLVANVNPGYRIKFISVGASAFGTNALTLATQGSDLFYIEQTEAIPSTIVLSGTQNSFEAIAFNNTLANTFWSINFNADPQWTTWTPGPVWSPAATATFTVNSARFTQSGKTVSFALDLSVSAGGSTSATILFNLPTTPASTGGGAGQESLANGKAISWAIRTAGSAVVNTIMADISAWANSARGIIGGTYESQ